MSGNIVIPSGNFITLTSLPVNPTDAANKSYVDANITPSATTSIQEKFNYLGFIRGGVGSSYNYRSNYFD